MKHRGASRFTERLVEGRPMRMKEAAAFLGLSKWSMYRLAGSGALPAFRSRGGKTLYFKKHDLEAWAYGSPAGPGEEQP